MTAIIQNELPVRELLRPGWIQEIVRYGARHVSMKRVV